MTKTKTYPTILDSIRLLIIMLALFGFSYAIIQFIDNLYNTDFINTPYAEIFMIILSEGFIIFYATKKSKLLYKDIFSFKKISPVVLISIAIFSTGMNIILSEFDNIIQSICSNCNHGHNTLESGFTNQNMFIAAIIIPVIIAPILEELIFRGIILNGYLKNYSKLTSIIISSLFFSLMHFEIGQSFQAFWSSLFFAWIYIKTNSLFSNIFAHFLSNSLHRILTYIFNINITGFNLNTDLVVHQPLCFDLLGIFLILLGSLLFVKLFGKNNNPNFNQI
ncbi:CPBP family intramembrane glutamic endopeptidase [Clostridium weizhouense]|uniref:CPBP family intramembrane metalloprotease n=1 Tax=Clostridium weizhouense TaxID=2859781 RepID=A0ABS7AQ07_9CLOT|nr:type II CAAX endopeptidase family protein [Clostridium weizhouense]MBW6410750.1 CPBP family intramembrane metalloprotease [Clostridium weizhouense]